MTGDLAIFVNSSDGFQDCWPAFFDLYCLYGGSLKTAKVVLNTERADYRSINGLDMSCSKTWPRADAKRPTWSESLLRGLAGLECASVLYLQEDYFFIRPVNVDLISEAMNALNHDPSVGVVYLNSYGPRFKRYTHYRGNLVHIQKPADYLVSTQAAVWRKDYLQSLMRPWENGWMFEKFGTLRAHIGRHKHLSVNPSVMKTAPAIDYVYTGVMKGKWNKDCIEVFREHGIHVDFSQRGFYEERGRLRSRLEVLQKLLGRPVDAVRSLSSIFYK
jgi:hypothetical protein